MSLMLPKSLLILEFKLGYRALTSPRFFLTLDAGQANEDNRNYRQSVKVANHKTNKSQGLLAKQTKNLDQINSKSSQK